MYTLIVPQLFTALPGCSFIDGCCYQDISPIRGIHVDTNYRCSAEAPVEASILGTFVIFVATNLADLEKTLKLPQPAFSWK